jgi:hypothetical protein
MEQRIDELKHDLAVDDFCRRSFFATEAAFRSVLVLFNLLSLWQTATRPASRPGTAGWRPGAPKCSSAGPSPIAGRDGRRPVLHLSQSWGGLHAHKPLIEQSLAWVRAISPPLEKTRVTQTELLLNPPPTRPKTELQSRNPG